MSKSPLTKALLLSDSLELNNDEFIRHFDYNFRTNTLSFFSECADEDFDFSSSEINNAKYDDKQNEWHITNDHGVEHTIQLFTVKALEPEKQIVIDEKKQKLVNNISEFLVRAINGADAADVINHNLNIPCSYVGNGSWSIDGTTYTEDDFFNLLNSHIQKLNNTYFDKLLSNINEFTASDIDAEYASFADFCNA